MKQLIGLLLLIMTVGTAKSAVTDTIPPYLQNPVIIPPFNLLLTDSTWFAKKDLPKKKFIVITYFSPTCGHCQEAAKELAMNMQRFKNVFFVMATSQDLDMAREFASMYGLDKFPNVRIGRDPQYFLRTFYAVTQTPFTAVYDKKGRFRKAFKEGYSIDEMEALVK